MTTRTANMLHQLGLKKSEVVAFVLPNLPEAHLAIWGGETAGIVFALNTMLEPGQMAELLKAADTRWLITPSPSADFDIWGRIESILPILESDGYELQGVLAVNSSHHPIGSSGDSGCNARKAGLPKILHNTPVYDFHVEIAKESGEHLNFPLPEAGDIASYFCTGGTTGLPKMRDAYSSK